MQPGRRDETFDVSSLVYDTYQRRVKGPRTGCKQTNVSRRGSGRGGVGKELKDGSGVIGESFLEKWGWVQIWTDRERKRNSLSLDEGTHLAEALEQKWQWHVLEERRDQCARSVTYEWWVVEKSELIRWCCLHSHTSWHFSWQTKGKGLIYFAYHQCVRQSSKLCLIQSSQQSMEVGICTYFSDKKADAQRY